MIGGGEAGMDGRDEKGIDTRLRRELKNGRAIASLVTLYFFIL